MYNKGYLDKVFGIRKDNDGLFRIGNSVVEIDNNSNIVIQNKTFTGTKGLYELLTRKKVNRSIITSDDLKTYKQILQITNGHLENNEPSNVIKTTRGTKFKDIISHLFPVNTRRSGIESALRRRWIRYK
jgi:hypothetical protein